MTIHSTRSGYIRYSHVILFLYAIVVACMISGYKGVANYIAFGSLLVLLFIWLVRRGWKVGMTKELLFVVWFMLYYVVTSLFNLDMDYFTTYTAYNLLLMFPVMICLILEKDQDRAFMRGCLKTTLVLWFAMCIYSIVLYIQNPTVARLAAADHETYSGVLIGGYQFAYGSSLLGVYFFSLLFDNRIKSGKIRWALIIGIVLLALAVYLTESTLTTFSFILGVIFVLLFDVNRDKSKEMSKRAIPIILLLAAVIVGYLVISANAATIATWLGRRTDIIFFRRVKEIFDSVFYDEQTRHYNERISLIEQSWKMFGSSPIFGVGYQYGNVFSSGKLMGVGNHSEIMDNLARHGIVGAIPLFGLYYRAFKRFHGSHVGVTAAFLLMISCNPFRQFGSCLILFLVLPLVEKLIMGVQKSSDLA